MNTSLLCTVLGSSLLLAACDSASKSEAKPTATAKSGVQADPEAKGDSTVAKAKPSKADPAPPTAAPADDDPLALTEVTPEGFWPIKVPKGAKQGAKTDTVVIYSMRDGDLNVQVKVFRGGGQKSLAKAKKWAGFEMANSEIVDAKQVAKGVFEVIMDRKSDGFKTVVMYNKDDRMVCYGTKVEVSLLRTICSAFPGAPAPSDLAASPTPTVPPDGGAAADAKSEGAHHCDLIKPIATCFQWNLAADAVGPKKEFCEGSGGKFVAGACPAKRDLGTCVLKGDKDIHYYAKKFKAASAEKECTDARSGSWTAK